MKERQILFSGPMGRALLDSRKTQTRRVVKPQPTYADLAGPPAAWQFQKREANEYWPWPNGRAEVLAMCPYGQPGDRLQVRETFFAWGRWEKRFNEKKSRNEWRFVDMTLDCGKAYRYAVDASSDAARERGSVAPQWWKRSALFMPRLASRLFLEITDVGVERLQNVSVADAIAEGIEKVDIRNGTPLWHLYGKDPGHTASAVMSYRSLWKSINGAGSWDANPWVWVVEFKRVGGTTA